jgi:hypothetical protein
MTYETLVRRVMEVEANEDIKKPCGEEPRPCNICEVRDSERLGVVHYYYLEVHNYIRFDRRLLSESSVARNMSILNMIFVTGVLHLRS